MVEKKPCWCKAILILSLKNGLSAVYLFINIKNE
ncbi:hypothetical protein CPS_1741 [Colwellia psychrerythraea 34H]|uniref:Uncharacterized protein n=1 Tax=Colwellia psychrerythraea (strain 34H / ATCC BAA-681) TaxID=167879 RepID=Q484P2_COLP3|nr:hypothetical protein CPS_1741 [Colwellia psychrerythraea 34H]